MFHLVQINDLTLELLDFELSAHFFLGGALCNKICAKETDHINKSRLMGQVIAKQYQVPGKS